MGTFQKYRSVWQDPVGSLKLHWHIRPSENDTGQASCQNPPSALFPEVRILSFNIPWPRLVLLGSAQDAAMQLSSRGWVKPGNMMGSSVLSFRICSPRSPKFYQGLVQSEVMFILPMATSKQSHCKQSSHCLFPTWVRKSSPVGRQVWLMVCLGIMRGLANFI